MDIDVSRFIAEIRLRPSLWGAGAGRGGRGQRIRHWDEIVSIFSQEGLSEEDRNTLERHLQSRWKNLRDAFVKEHRLRTDASNRKRASRKKRYKHYDELKFLQSYVTNRRHRASATEDDDTEESEPKIKRKSTKKKTTTPEDDSVRDIEVSDVFSYNYQAPVSEDPDRQFLLSLLSDFKAVPDRCKAQLKINILKCIMEGQRYSRDPMYIEKIEHD